MRRATAFFAGVLAAPMPTGHRLRAGRVAWAAVAGLLAAPGAATAADAAPDFNRDVRPILSSHCFKCHGPDDASRKARLRLDTPEGAALVLKGGADSLLVERIFSEDEAEVMPPPSTKKPLSDREKQVLRAWAVAGGQYAPHWAFVPVTRPPVPAIPEAPAAPGTPPPHPIDAFVRERLAREGLKPSPPADKATLLRRVYLDLIGIPPTPEETEAFLNDPAPDAYEKVVDRLLASPHYGERWARRWLDLARYADTNGYEKDRPRTIWPYRDWVIRAINDDLPFDRFTIEQLAGDLLPNPTPQQRIATGFHRNTMLNEEGGIDPLEFRYYAVVDRVNTTATTWLGLTLGCAQCHTHKYDPFTHTEYFRLLAFFNNADEPEFAFFSPEQARRRAELEAKIEELQAALPEKLPAEKRRAAFQAWLTAARRQATPWVVLKPTRLDGGPHTRLTVQPDGSVLATGDPTKHDIYTLTLTDLPAGTKALRVEALPHDSLPARGPGRAYYEGPKGDFLLGELSLFVGDRKVTISTASEAPARPKTPAASALDGNTQTGWASPGNEGKASQAVFVLREPLTAPSARLELVFERHYAASLGHFRISATTADGACVREWPAEIEALLCRTDAELTAEDHATLLRYWATVAPELQAARDEIAALRRQLPQPTTTLVMQERPADHPRPTHRHHRGEFLEPREPVTPGVPAVLPPLRLQPGEPPNRLALARWLVSRENPLTARVTVNRHWQAFFGRGLVRTVDDFGYQGEPPSHPELLDWLAAEFMEPSYGLGEGPRGRGRPAPWSVKHLHRTIVTSATYRQSSRLTAELAARDPENVLLARGPRVRLEAEQIRDAVLKAAGLLSPKLYGPSVFPPQPPGVTTEGTYGALPWKVSEGEDRYRRGLYTFAKRTAPFAMSSTFDAPSGEACVARREVTNTALQALTMLNDVVILDAARSLGRLLADQPGRTEDRVRLLVRRCLVRSPEPWEVARLAAFFETQRKRFAAAPRRAAAVLGADAEQATDRGEPNRDSDRDSDRMAELAAWVVTARAVFNLDEFVTKQ